MKDTGGPAFPHSRLGSDADGMTLRDYFAAKAMQSVLHGARMPGIDADPLPPEVSQALAAIAKVSYRVADAMLAERSKT